MSGAQGEAVLRQWFATSAGGRWVWAPGRVRLEPVGTVHAKRMGTLTTACGVSATSWQKFWDIPFAQAGELGQMVCEPCLAAVGLLRDALPTVSGLS